MTRNQGAELGQSEAIVFKPLTKTPTNIIAMLTFNQTCTTKVW